MGLSGLPSLWCLIDPRMAIGIESIEPSLRYAESQIFCRFLRVESLLFSSRSILRKGDLETNSYSILLKKNNYFVDT